MNKREFIKSAAVITGAAALTPLSATVKSSLARPTPSGKGSAIENGEAGQKATLKKSLGYGMINEELPLVDKLKLVVDLGFHGVELNAPVDIPMTRTPRREREIGHRVPHGL